MRTYAVTKTNTALWTAKFEVVDDLPQATDQPRASPPPSFLEAGEVDRSVSTSLLTLLPGQLGEHKETTVSILVPVSASPSPLPTPAPGVRVPVVDREKGSGEEKREGVMTSVVKIPPGQVGNKEEMVLSVLVPAEGVHSDSPAPVAAEASGSSVAAASSTPSAAVVPVKTTAGDKASVLTSLLTLAAGQVGNKEATAMAVLVPASASSTPSASAAKARTAGSGASVVTFLLTLSAGQAGNKEEMVMAVLVPASPPKVKSHLAGDLHHPSESEDYWSKTKSPHPL